MRYVPDIVGTVLVMCIPVAAQTSLTYQEYEQQLTTLLSRDQKFREEIAQEQARIADCKQKIAESRKRVLELRDKKYSLLGIDEAGLISISRSIDSMAAELAGYDSLNDQLFSDKSERIDTLRGQYEEFTKKPAARISRIKNKLFAVQSLLDAAETRFISVQKAISVAETASVATDEQPETLQTTYTVGKTEKKPETLISIAKKMYGDPYRWKDIYQANQKTLDKNFKRYSQDHTQSSIANPSDLILPGQVLAIPR